MRHALRLVTDTPIYDALVAELGFDPLRITDEEGKP